MALAAFNLAKTHEQAMHRFQAFLDDRSTELLSPDTKRVNKNGNFYMLFPFSYEPFPIM